MGVPSPTFSTALPQVPPTSPLPRVEAKPTCCTIGMHSLLKERGGWRPCLRMLNRGVELFQVPPLHPGCITYSKRGVEGTFSILRPQHRPFSNESSGTPPPLCAKRIRSSLPTQREGWRAIPSPPQYRNHRPSYRRSALPRGGGQPTGRTIGRGVEGYHTVVPPFMRIILSMSVSQACTPYSKRGVEGFLPPIRLPQVPPQARGVEGLHSKCLPTSVPYYRWLGWVSPPPQYRTTAFALGQRVA